MLTATRYKYEMVVDELRKLIGDGVYSDRLPSVRTMAGEFGVDTRTVLKAVELLEQERLVHTDGTRGIKVCNRDNRKPRSGIINLVHPMLNVAGGPEKDLLVQSLFKTLERTDCRVILTMQCERIMDDPAYWANNNFDGYIFLYGNEKRNLEAHKILTRLQLPAVYTNRAFSDQTVYDWVDFDNLSMMNTLFDLLLRSGHRRIAYLEDYRPSRSFAQRLELYRNFMAKHLLDFPEYLCCDLVMQGDDDNLTQRLHFVEAYAQRLLNSKQPPTALFLFDLPPAPLISAFRRNGLELNKDYVIIQKKSISGKDNSPTDGVQMIYADFDLIARAAIKHLNTIIENPETRHSGKQIPLTFCFNDIPRVTN